MKIRNHRGTETRRRKDREEGEFAKEPRKEEWILSFPGFLGSLAAFAFSSFSVPLWFISEITYGLPTP
jgi:hypothetical protein